MRNKNVTLNNAANCIVCCLVIVYFSVTKCEYLDIFVLEYSFSLHRKLITKLYAKEINYSASCNYSKHLFFFPGHNQ